MALVKFFRGSKASYVANGKHLNSVYFAKDTQELLLNGVAYGLSVEALEALNSAIAAKVASVDFTDNSKIVLKDGNGTTVKEIVIAEATQSVAGLMSAADKVKLDGLKTGAQYDEAINQVAGDLADEAEARLAKDNEQAGQITGLTNRLDAVEPKVEKNITDIQGLRTDVNTLLGTGEGGGSIDERIENAVKDVIGDAQTYKTLGALEDAVQGNAGSINDINTEMGDKSSSTITATTVWGAIQELETEANTAHGDLSDEIDAVQKDLNDFKATKGIAGGLASLDENGLVPASQLPSYVDDVVEADSVSAFPTTGEASKIYVAKDTNKTYRWSGTQYTEISASLALGETTGTAYEGSKGKANADAIAAHVADVENPHQVTKAQVGLGNVENLAPADMPVSTATQTELDKKAVKTEVEGQFNTVNQNISKVAEDLAKEVKRSSDKDTAHETALGNLADADEAIVGRLNVIEGEATQAGSIKKALADANAYADSLLTWGEEA